METKEMLFSGFRMNGFAMLFVHLVLLTAVIVFCFWQGGTWLYVTGGVLIALWFVFLAGYMLLEPNEARMFKAESLWGPWEQLSSPFEGKDAEKSFHSQGTYIFKVEGTDGGYVFMADRWNPRSLKNSRHIWLPIRFKTDGTPVIRWMDSWSPQEEFGREE